jgi:undecaprenyl-diphosphatase
MSIRRAAPAFRWLASALVRLRDMAGLPFLLSLAVFVLAVRLFLRIASELAERELDMLDAVGRAWAVRARTSSADTLFGIVTHAGSTVALLVVSVTAALLLRRRHRGRLLIPVVLSPVAASLLALGLKHYFSRTRPDSLAAHGLGYSFPSGHTTGVTAVALTLSYILVRERLMSGIHLVWVAFLVLMVGASRVYLGVHWASDVLGGWTVGIAITACCCAVYERLVANGEPTPGRP